MIVVPFPFVQFGAVSAGLAFGSQSFTDELFKVIPLTFKGAESFVNKFLVCATFFGPAVVSGAAKGSGAP